MNGFLRWSKFNLVGALGMGVQLAVLACLNRWFRGHYLFASVAAIEITLLHNFVWHVKYTWNNRCNASNRLRQFVRFHLSNGIISMLGNVILMRLFVHELRLPLLASNAVAIICCSMANYSIGNVWVFPAVPEGRSRRRSKGRLGLDGSAGSL
jgi:putative flippase GtrA